MGAQVVNGIAFSLLKNTNSATLFAALLSTGK